MQLSNQTGEPAKAPGTSVPAVRRLFLAMATALALGHTAVAQSLAPGLTSGVVFTADEYGFTISRIDLGSGEVTMVPATIEPHNIQISPDGSRLLAVGLPPDMHEETTDQSSGGGMVGMDVRGEVVLFDPHHMAAGPVSRIEVGMHPAHVITDLNGTRAFVTNAEDDTLSVIDLAPRKVTATVTTGDYPHACG